jgi:hypothetical protein
MRCPPRAEPIASLLSDASADMFFRCDPGQERADLAVLELDFGLRHTRCREVSRRPARLDRFELRTVNMTRDIERFPPIAVTIRIAFDLAAFSVP